MNELKIRSIIIPRIPNKLAYIHTGKMYEGRKVGVIRKESITFPGQVISIYSAYDETGELICSIEQCPLIVYYYGGTSEYVC